MILCKHLLTAYVQVALNVVNVLEILSCVQLIFLTTSVFSASIMAWLFPSLNAAYPSFEVSSVPGFCKSQGFSLSVERTQVIYFTFLQRQFCILPGVGGVRLLVRAECVRCPWLLA